MAEDAAQEERLRRLRHPVARRHRRQRHRARHHRELPDADLPAQRAGARAADRSRSIAASASTTGRSRSSAGRRPSATITASRAAATGCSSSASPRSRSPSPPHPPKTDQAAIAETLADARTRRLRGRLASTKGPRLGGGHAHQPEPRRLTDDRWPPSHAPCHWLDRGRARTAGMPAHAQLTVFDPTNFSQNVLMAARDAAADQQPNPEPAERGDVAHQPGAQSGEPALFVAGAT